MVGIDHPHGPGPESVNLSRECHNASADITNMCNIGSMSLSNSPEKLLEGVSSSSTLSMESSSSDSDSRCSPIESSPICQVDSTDNLNNISESEVAAGGRLQVQPTAGDNNTTRCLTRTAKQFFESRNDYESNSALSSARKRNRGSPGIKPPILMHALRAQRRKGGEDTNNPSIVSNTSLINKQTNQRNRKSVRWSNVVQMKDIKFKIDPVPKRALSISEVAGNRLYWEGIEREKRLALLRKKYYAQQEKKRTIPHQSKSIKTCQRLYSLSKSKQEDGKRRRNHIVTLHKKANEVYVHPTTKISIADSTRLYRVGIEKIIALELRRINASDSRVYKSNLITKRAHTKE